MTCAAELKRRYPTLHEAWAYLEGRGFVCTGGGWVNGRWSASVVPGADGVDVTVWLRGCAKDQAAA
ncbi:MAG: hypothetical protein JO021_25680 [Alphaproteobacteria bacterium]|nr:hypothetical protein [Alphaproteobacteria bacterium]